MSYNVQIFSYSFLIQGNRIDFDVAMPHQLGHPLDVHPCLKQLAHEGAPRIVGVEIYGHI